MRTSAVLTPGNPRHIASIGLLTTLLAAILTAQGQSLRLISAVNPGASDVAAGGDSTCPVMTPDGRFVLFSSSAVNLLPLGTNSSLPARVPRPANVYLRDCSNGSISLVSVDLAGTMGGDGYSSPKAISDDGRFVLFESEAGNLVPGDTNGVSDVFVLDTRSGTITLVSANSNGIPANGPSGSSFMSADAHFVAFSSMATDLVENDTNRLQDVFVRDLQKSITTRASVGATGAGPRFLSGASDSPVLTPDGRFLLFTSSATNLIASVNTPNELYLRDRLTGTILWVSAGARAILKASAGTTNALSFNPMISDDGRLVVYEACPNLNAQLGQISRVTPGVLLRYDHWSGETAVLHTNTANAAIAEGALSMTHDATKIAFVAYARASTNSTTCILVWDAGTGLITLASGDLTNGIPDGSESTAPVLDATGRYVLFLSTAPGLVTNELSGEFHLYVRDLVENTTRLVDADADGKGSGVDLSASASISSGGQFVAFSAPDGTLLRHDRNLDRDIFLRNLVEATNKPISFGNPTIPNTYPNGPAGISPGSISATGEFVAFRSLASGQLDFATNGAFNVFVEDTSVGAIELVSINTNGIPADRSSFDPAISGDGQLAAFSSYADDIAPGVTLPTANVYARERQSQTTLLVSVSRDGSTGGDGDSTSPVCSTDGRFILFKSSARNLVSPTLASAMSRLYQRDLQLGRTFLITANAVSAASMTPDGLFVAAATGSAGSATPTQLQVWDSMTATNIYATNSSGQFGAVSFSPDGRKVVYALTGNVTPNPQLSALDIAAKTNWIIASRYLASNPGLSFSADGRFLAYAAATGISAPGTKEVFLYDFETGTNVSVTRSFGSDAPAKGTSDMPCISADGRFIAYRSTAVDLVPGDNNGAPDIFIYDRQSGSTTLLSASWRGPWSADNRSGNPVFSGDGKVLFFESWASDLLNAGPANRGSVFAYEFLASSEIPLFRAKLIPATDGLWITWPVIPGKTYRAEFTDDLNAPAWQPCAEGVSITGSQGSLRTSATTGQRFFRVVAQ